MLDGLPNRPVQHGTVDALNEMEKIEQALPLCELGAGDQRLVVQFLIITDGSSTTFCCAAPEDSRDGWFKLVELEEDNGREMAEASQAADEYMQQYGEEGYLEEYAGIEVGDRGPQVFEAEFTI